MADLFAPTQQGRRVRFTTLAALANELQAADSRREFGRVVARYARTEFEDLYAATERQMTSISNE